MPLIAGWETSLREFLDAVVGTNWSLAEIAFKTADPATLAPGKGATLTYAAVRVYGSGTILDDLVVAFYPTFNPPPFIQRIASRCFPTWPPPRVGAYAIQR
ncbi:MAG TPA: hypothetical protein PLU39_15540 [Armatimonadota bacterium]|nr:hypothetical protein [Armatimonadota bacterium]HPT99278.1 hypothetical protein [Armatimonadota bacterium]